MDETAIRAQVVACLQRAGASFGFVFGSRATGGSPRPDSDLDVAAFWADASPASWETILPDHVDLLVLNQAPLEMAGKIALHGELLFETDPAARVRWVATTRKIWLDERPRFERAHGEFMAALRGR